MEQQYDILLKQVLATGSYYAAVALQGAQRKQKVLRAPTEFIEFINQCNVNGLDGYFGLSVFTQGWHTNSEGKKTFRTQANAAAQRALWLDIDAGDGKPYATVEAAVNAVNAFASQVGINAPTLVCSGGGVHAYWPLTEDIATASWRALAEGLHTAVGYHQFHADPSRTRDPASILRLPGTFNFKRAEPRPVYLIQVGVASYPGALYDAFSKYPRQEMALAAPVGFLDTSALRKYDNLPDVLATVQQSRPQSAKAVISSCAQIRDQNGAPEPVWRGMLSIITKCDDGIAAAHELSAQDPRYSRADTEQKIMLLQSGDIGPYLCTTFESHRPEKCAGCPHRGLIKSPIALSTIEEQTTVIAQTIDETGRMAARQIEIPPLQGPGAGGFKVSSVGCIKIESRKGKDGTWYDADKIFYPHPVYPIQRIWDKTVGKNKEVFYIWRFHHESGYDDVEISGATLASSSLTKELGRVGISNGSKDAEYMEEFMRTYMKNVRNMIAQSTLENSLGWTAKGDGFVLGNMLYKNGQSIELNLRGGDVAEYSNFTVPEGTLDAWKAAANIYNRPGMEWAQVVVCAGFASPLMSMGAMEKAALLSIVGERGHGKTTAQRVALAIYGNPAHLLMSPEDTINARITKMGMAHSIAVMMDEMTGLSAAEASALVYSIPQGKGKDRLGSGGSGLIRNNTEWSTMPCISANKSIIDTLAKHAPDASAQMTRVIELQSTNPYNLCTEAEMQYAKTVTTEIEANYGHAGDLYIRTVTKYKKEIVQMIRTYEVSFMRKAGLTNSERFWTYMATRLMIAASLASQLKLIDYDLVALESYLVREIVSMKNKVEKTVYDESSWLGDFCNEHAAEFIEVTTDKRPKFREDGTAWPDAHTTLHELNDTGYAKYSSNMRKIVGRRISDTGVTLISKKALTDWCKENNLEFNKLMDHLRQTNRLVPRTTMNEERTDLGAGTFHRNKGMVKVIRVNSEGVT